ncbi:MFS transporter [Sphingomonas rosea]|uniref:MFS transporter n=1 Tax=Sphingomonas rosea TaxID=335605 RepID=A0ABP7TT87_9SPHN
MTAAARATTRSPSLVLLFLLLAYILNFLDRQILGILAAPIQADLKLTDSEFGTIAGIAFAILYSVLGVPLALLADRTSRSWVVTASLAVWSGFTALCGTATGFWQLFLYRLGVGIGEAGGVAPSYAIISDYFPPERRARALGIYSLGVPLGLGGGTIIGAYLAANFNWQTAFFVMGMIGLVLAPILKWVVRDLPKPVTATPAERPRAGTVFKTLAAKPTFWLLAFAASMSSLVGYGLALWTPSILIRSFDLSLIQSGQFMSSLLLIGGTAGVFAGGVLADKLGHLDRKWYALLPAIAWLVTAPFFLFGFLSPNLTIAWPLLLIPNALNILWLGPITTAVQHLVAPAQRATAAGFFLLINNLIGLGVGPKLIGAISTHLKTSYGAESLRYAAMGVLGFYLVAALLAFIASRRLDRDWVEETPA